MTPLKPKVLIVARYNSLISHRVEAHMVRRLFEKGIDLEILTNERSQHAIAFENAGITVHYGHPEDKISVGSIKKIRELIKTRGFEIIHLFNSRAISNGVLAAKGLDVRVVTYRGSGDLHWHDPMAYLTHLNPRVDKISCLSNYVKKQVDKQFLFRKKKTVVHYKAFLPEWFDNVIPADLEQFGIPRRATVAACAANYRKVKGIEYLLKATPLLAGNPEFHLLILGSGMDIPGIQKLVRNSPMNNRIHFGGYRDDIYEVIKACHIYIQPSLKEGLSKSVIEAMAQEIPCVVSNVGGLPELIEHNVSGLLVPPKNPEALASAILKLVNDKDLRDTLGKNARKRLFQKFSMDKYVDGVYDMYLDLLSSKK